MENKIEKIVIETIPQKEIGTKGKPLEPSGVDASLFLKNVCALMSFSVAATYALETFDFISDYPFGDSPILDYFSLMGGQLAIKTYEKYFQ